MKLPADDVTAQRVRPGSHAELAQLIAQGATVQTLVEALGQRAIRVDRDWDWENEGAQCDCGLLLVELPRPVKLARVVVTLGRAMPVEYEMTHAHAADDAGNPVCPDCADGGEPCGAPHQAEMCDTPVPVQCSHCTEAALPGEDFCPECRPYEPEWDKDRYLGIYL
jgi:hypothetical protein